LPFWDEDAVRDVLSKVFGDELGVYDFGDLKKKPAKRELRIVAADIKNSKPITYKDDDVPVVNAILDSCGIPFYFRVRGKHHIVDGGICENLPIELLEDGVQEYGPILAIGFERRPSGTPESLVKFMSALLDTAMNHSMHRARARIPSEYLFEVKPEFGTFDFADAIERGFGEYYIAERGRATEFFRPLIDRLMKRSAFPVRLQGHPWSRGDRETMHKLGDLWREVFSKRLLTYHSVDYVVQANSLFTEGHPLHGQPDVITSRASVTPVEWPYICHSYAFAISPPASGAQALAPDTADDDTSLVERSWTVSDSGGNPIQTTFMAALDRSHPIDRRMLLFFSPLLEPDGPHKPPYTAEIRDLGKDILGPLVREGQDYLELVFDRAKGPVTDVRLMVHIPTNGPKLRVQPDDVSRAHGAVTLRQLEMPPPPAGFEAYGIAAKGFPGDKVLRMDIFRA